MKNRAEVEKEDTWALEAMYDSEEALQNDYEALKCEKANLSRYKGHLMDCPENLWQALETQTKLSKIMDRLLIYTAMNYDVDSTNGHSLELKNKMQRLYTELCEEDAYFEPELLTHSFTEIEEMMKQLPCLEAYRRSLTLLFTRQGHTLKEEEEKIVSKFSNVLNTGNTSSYALRNSDLSFGTVQGEEGEEITLTNHNYSKLMQSQDRDLRKRVFKQYHQGYHQMRNTLASLYHSEVEKHVRLAQLYHYQSAREMALSRNEIPEIIYDQLLEGVHASLPILFDYYDLKKQVLGLPEFHLYDLYADLVPSTEEKTYSFEEAKTLVIDALGILGPDYQALVKKAFDERWIDRYPNVGKRPGAYSWGCYDSTPYILTNFTGTYHDVSTLAHEIGHSIHSYLSKENNPYQHYSYKIFVAEVASTTNEFLFNDYMLKHSKDQKEQLMILNQQMELFKSTIFRQAMFAEAELKFHQIVEEGGSLTADTLEELYLDLNRTYFGPNVVIDEEIKSEWSRIPHFYMNFYVYQYATGLAASANISSRILKGEEGAVANYLKFLTLGGSMPPVEELKVAGVDMSRKETVLEAVDLFASTIARFKEQDQERN